MREPPTDSGEHLTHLQSSGAEAARDALAAAYPNAADFTFPSGDGCIRFSTSILLLDDLAIYRTCTTGYRCSVEGGETVRVTIPIRGRLVVTDAGGERAAVAGAFGAVCSEERIVRNVLPDYRGFHFKVSPQRLTRHASLLADANCAADAIAPLVCLTDPVGAMLYRNMARFFDDAEQLVNVGLGHLAPACGNDVIVNLAVLALMPAFRERLSRTVTGVGHGVADRARQYLDAHAADPVRFSALAEHLGVGLRALQIGFKKRFGCTLSDYLFDCRLRLARARLTAPASNTVARIAVECGFTNAGAFAARYRMAFGELPSQTLHRARL
jgi:AraC-like DNA-binding protein